MSRINRHIFGTVFTLLFAGVFIFGLAASSAAPAFARPLASEKASRLAYYDEWRKLWEDHITWTRIVILGILDELPGTSAYTDRLIQNYEDMEDALAPYYGEEDAEELGDLIQEHLVIAAELLTAAHDDDTTAFDDAKERWYDNAQEIARKMSEMNPKFWPLKETRKMWTEHLDATLEEATTHLNGDFTGEVAAHDKVHDLALEMADFISSGVMQQFPGKFQGPMP